MISTRRSLLAGMGGFAAVASAPNATATPAVAARFFVAMLTPADREGSLDAGLTRDLLAFLRHRGADGVVVMGTTGEFSSFSVAERKQMLEIVTKSKGTLDLMCHVGTPNLPETLDLLSHAADHGAGAALAIPPFYYKNPKVEGLERYYTRVLESARIPILLYHIPAASGVPITPELVRRLSRHERLHGLKDSSGDPETLMTFLKEFPRLKVFTGSPKLISQNLRNGGAGAITGNGNVITAETAAVFRDFRAGKEIGPAQERLNQAAQICGGDLPSMKFMLGEMGLRPSYSRPPLAAPGGPEKTELKTRVAKLKSLR